MERELACVSASEEMEMKMEAGVVCMCLGGEEEGLNREVV